MPDRRSPSSDAPTHATARRAICSRCLRPGRTCICHLAVSIPNEVEVLVLQHPLETGNAKGTVRLLHLCLPHSRIVVGEAFAEEELRKLLHAPFPPAEAGGAVETPASMDRQPILLYPDTPPMPSNDMARPEHESRMPLQPYSCPIRLVVLDGTWRKSRKMLYLNPLLQRLARLPLRDPPPSRYLIRKAHGEHQLSSFEATCYALMQLERDDAKYAPLLKAFSGFVAQQSGYRTLGERKLG